MPQSAVLPPFARQFHLFLDRQLPHDIEAIPIPGALARAIPKRRTQFQSGRYCAMKAMEALWSRAPQPVGRGSTGAPLWPEGLVGSITHTDDFASAAVAHATDAIAMGIDTERIMSELRADHVSRVVARPVEVAHACAAGLNRLEALTLVFSAKESIFKCLHPLVSCYFDFRDVHIIAVDGRHRTFAARLVRTMSDGFAAQTILEGHFDVEVPWIHTGMALQPECLCRALA